MGIFQKIKRWRLLRKMRIVMEYEQQHKVMETSEEYIERNDMVDFAIERANLRG